MAIQINDKLSEIINNTVVSERNESFVWISLSQWDDKFFTIQTAARKFRDCLADQLSSNENFKPWIVHNLNHSLIPEYHMDWLFDSHRQTKWIEQYITTQTFIYSNTQPHNSNFNLSLLFARTPVHLLGRMRSIAIFDFWAANVFRTMDQRIQQCHAMKVGWDRITEEGKQFSWLNESDAEEKREFFHKWLKLKHHSLLSNTTNFQSHEELLSFFDQAIFTKAEKTLISQRSRNAWNQQQRRANSKGKKQCNFVLSERAIAKLEKLSSKYKLSRTEIIELLIDSESRDESYILARLNMKERLTMQI